MVEKEVLENIFDNIINTWNSKSFHDNLKIKCPTSSKARKRGRGGVQHGSENPFENEDGIYDITYPDGTKIVLSTTDDIVSLTIDGKEYPYLAEDCYTNFNYQTDELKNSGSVHLNGAENIPLDFDNNYEFLKSYSDIFASFEGLWLNKHLLQGDELLSTGRSLPLNKISHDYFVELEKNNRVDNQDYVTLRYVNALHENDSIDKLTYINKQHTCLSAGGDIEELESTFGQKKNRNRYNRTVVTLDEPYKIYTYIKKDSGVKGLFLGNALNDVRAGSDWEAEVNLPPRSKFERDLIDEERRIIIQHVVV